MLSNFRIQGDIHSGQINIVWHWAGTSINSKEAHSGLRLVRKERAYPQTVEDGITVVDLGKLADFNNTTIKQLSTDDSEHSLWQISVKDKELVPGKKGRGLESGKVYYYAIFKEEKGLFSTKHEWRGSAFTTANYQFSDQLYDQLPSIHRYYDEPELEHYKKGQLRRFLQVFGTSLDQIRGTAESLENRHDILNVDALALPRLARWIGWEPDITAKVPELRNDILHAPEIYQTVGTLPNLQAIVNRVTGWDCKLKEFAHNVFYSNAPEKIRLWEIWQADIDSKNDPAKRDIKIENEIAVTHTDGFHGSPVYVSHKNKQWLIYHSDDSAKPDEQRSRRNIWFKWHNASESVTYPAQFFDHQKDSLSIINEYPASIVDNKGRLWLFWVSNRDGVRDIWSGWDNSNEPFKDVATSTSIENLTKHKADDCNPAVVCDQSGKIWLFWQSNRRGATDIWCHTFDAENNKKQWEAPVRVSNTALLHESPTAVVDNENRVWLFYSQVSGVGSNLLVQVYDRKTQQWSTQDSITKGKYRNESPGAIFWQQKVWLFWHSNQTGSWQVQGKLLTWDSNKRKPDFSDKSFTITTDISGNKEPSVYIDEKDPLNKQLKILWRSQKRGRQYQSCSFDINNTSLKVQAGSYKDRLHYSYDTGKTNSNFYARDVIGIYLTPDRKQADSVDRNHRLINDPLRQFLPINVRPVLVNLPALDKENIYTYDAPELEHQRRIGESLVSQEMTIHTLESYTGPNEITLMDTIPEWQWIFSWSKDHSGHYSVDFTTQTINTNQRTWHTRVKPGS